jgi:hypothetical protein
MTRILTVGALEIELHRMVRVAAQREPMALLPPVTQTDYHGPWFGLADETRGDAGGTEASDEPSSTGGQ